MRIRLLGTEAALSTTSGNTFDGATIVRLVNTASSGVTVTLNESNDSTAVGTFTIAAGQTEYLEKGSDQKVRGAVVVMANKVGFTH
jgi:hypothetical protein